MHVIVVIVLQFTECDTHWSPCRVPLLVEEHLSSIISTSLRAETSSFLNNSLRLGILNPSSNPHARKKRVKRTWNLKEFRPPVKRWHESREISPVNESKVNAPRRNLWKKKNISSPNSPHWREQRRQAAGDGALSLSLSLSCFHFNFYPLAAGCFLRARWRTLPFSLSLSFFYSVLLSFVPLVVSSVSFSLLFERVCSAHGGVLVGSWPRQTTLGGEIGMIENVNVWLGLHRRACNVVNESVYFPAA